MQATFLLSAAEDIPFIKEVAIDETFASEEFDTNEMHPLNGDQQSEADLYTVMSDTIWVSIYPSLRSLARYLVHTSPLPSWRGQEDDMAEDIVQETVRRVIEHAKKARRGEALPIQSLKQMATTVAYNYYRDLKRHDYRISRLDTIDISLQDQNDLTEEDLLTKVAEEVDQNSLFEQLVQSIQQFPAKQKQAILNDLANLMSFDKKMTPLQMAFLSNGIDIQKYRQPLPKDPRERSRHISLCSHAYKRIAHLPYIADDNLGAQASLSATSYTNTPTTEQRIQTHMMPLTSSSSTHTNNMRDVLPTINPNENAVSQDHSIIFLISNLTEPYKSSLHKRIIEKQTYPEIAKCMCLPIGTVKSHVSRGMKILQKRMDMNEVDGSMTKKEIEGSSLLLIEQALAKKQVPEPYRTVLHLHYVNKQTYAAIALNLQIPIGTVKSYINRGKKFLSKYL
jgi:RNA polymerase sigma factor (sigma-70 family)